MQFIKKLFNSTQEKSFQNKNEAVFACMREHGFSLPAIRRALMDLNGIRLADVSDGRSIVNASNTIAGRRRGPTVIQALAARLNMPAETLFPRED